jgi:hypothetical protein
MRTARISRRSKSLADLLTQVLGSLHTGDPLKRRRPTIQEGTLIWDWQI